MRWNVSTRVAAKTDLLLARDWYESKRVGLGNEFLAAIADVFVSLEETPDRFPVYYNGFRRALAQRFPYKIFFRIENENVIVFRILHAARDHTSHLR
jgi:plasmid stabilization system protein ParE